MSERIQILLSRLRAGLEELYESRLRALYLYGSFARADEDPESDVDVLVVLDRIDAYGAEIDRTSVLVSELSLEFGISVSRVFVSEADWANRDTPFLANARDEAIAA